MARLRRWLRWSLRVARRAYRLRKDDTALRTAAAAVEAAVRLRCSVLPVAKPTAVVVAKPAVKPTRAEANRHAIALAVPSSKPECALNDPMA